MSGQRSDWRERLHANPSRMEQELAIKLQDNGIYSRNLRRSCSSRLGTVYGPSCLTWSSFAMLRDHYNCENASNCRRNESHDYVDQVQSNGEWGWLCSGGGFSGNCHAGLMCGGSVCGVDDNRVI